MVDLRCATTETEVACFELHVSGSGDRSVCVVTGKQDVVHACLGSNAGGVYLRVVPFDPMTTPVGWSGGGSTRGIVSACRL